MGNNTVSCLVREILPAGSTTCDMARGRRVPELETDRTFVDEMGVTHTVCDIQQIATNPMTRMPVSTDPGWYYDTAPDPQNPACTQRISFTGSGSPGPGTTTRLECIQYVPAAGRVRAREPRSVVACANTVGNRGLCEGGLLGDQTENTGKNPLSERRPGDCFECDESAGERI